MITIYGLYFLLLVELLAVLAAAAALLFIRMRKYRGLYQTTQHELGDTGAMLASLKKQMAEQTALVEKQSAEAPEAAIAGEQKGAADASGGLIARVAELESQLKEKDTKMTAIEAKFTDLEKEYMILYQQQQSQPDTD